jgi:hypothetical protein
MIIYALQYRKIKEFVELGEDEDVVVTVETQLTEDIERINEIEKDLECMRPVILKATQSNIVFFIYHYGLITSSFDFLGVSFG